LHFCLVAIEPVSNFILVEKYALNRKTKTWDEAVSDALKGLPVEVIQVASDEGRSLISHALKGLKAHHSPACFHGIYEIGRGTAGALMSIIRKTEKEHENTVKETLKIERAKERYYKANQIKFYKEGAMQVRPQVTYPGVYVQEVPSGVRTIVGVSTSTAMFMGRIAGGILNKPIRCLNYSDFANNFSEDISVGDMARYVKLFFLNGGTDCYVIRLANGAKAASVTLQSVDNTNRIRLIAKQQGTLGENIRASVTYSSRYPEVTFNTTIFSWEKDKAGNRVKKDVEEWKGLSMDPNSPLYAVDFLTQESKLVKAERVGNHDPTEGFSLAGRPVVYDNSAAANRRDAWQAVAGKFGISTDGSSYATVNFDAIDFTGISITNLGSVKTDLENEIKVKINEATSIPVADITVTILDGPAPPGSAAPKNTTDMLKIILSKRDVFIRPASSNDMAVPMMFGSEQGGLEVGAFAYLRPVPTGISLNIGGNDGNIYNALLKIAQKNVSQVTLPEMQADGTFADKDIPVNLKTTGPNDPMYVDKDGGEGGLREKLAIIRDEINKYREKNPTKFFRKANLCPAAKS